MIRLSEAEFAASMLRIHTLAVSFHLQKHTSWLMLKYRVVYR